MADETFDDQKYAVPERPRPIGQIASVQFRLDNDADAREVLEKITSLGLPITQFSIAPNIDFGYPY